MIMFLLSLYFKVGKILINHHSYKIPWSYFWSKNYHIYENPVPLSVRYPWSYMHDTFYLQTMLSRTTDLKVSLPFRETRQEKFLAQAQVCLIPSPASSLWHFGVWSTSAPITLPIHCSSVSSSSKSDSFLSATSKKIFLDKSKCILLSSHSMSSSPISIHQ